MKATTSIAALSCLAGSILGGRLKIIRALYQAIVIPQITYGCSEWYCSQGLPDHRKCILKSLQTIQGQASRRITWAFKATSLPALDIETFLLPIGLELDKFASDSLLQIVSGQLYETIINNSPKLAPFKQLSSLESLTRQFEERSGLSIVDLEKTVPFIAPPWWIPTKTTIAPNKSEAKQNHDQLAQNLNSQNHLIIYTDGSGINNKIGEAAVVPTQEIIYKASLGSTQCFTVYSRELQGVAMALNIITSQITHSQISQATIFTNNQSTIRSIENPLSR